jgi:hypothetical protein
VQQCRLADTRLAVDEQARGGGKLVGQEVVEHPEFLGPPDDRVHGATSSPRRREVRQRIIAPIGALINPRS